LIRNEQKKHWLSTEPVYINDINPGFCYDRFSELQFQQGNPDPEYE
jgi:hypothetical protein